MVCVCCVGVCEHACMRVCGGVCVHYYTKAFINFVGI